MSIRLYHAHRALLTYGYNLAESEEYAAAVVFAQMASELCVYEAVAARLEVNGTKTDEEAFAAIQTFNLRPTNRPLRDLFESVAESPDLVSQPFWAELAEHLSRRHRVVHQGDMAITLAEGEHSIRTVLSLIEYVEARARAIL